MFFHFLFSVSSRTINNQNQYASPSTLACFHVSQYSWRQFYHVPTAATTGPVFQTRIHLNIFQFQPVVALVKQYVKISLIRSLDLILTFSILLFLLIHIYIYSSSSVSFLINHPQLLCPLLRYLNLLLSSSSVLSSLSSLILRSLKPTRLLLDRRSLSAVIRRSQWQKHVSNFNYKFLTLQRSKGRINQPTIQLFFLDKIFDFKFKPMFR